MLRFGVLSAMLCICECVHECGDVSQAVLLHVSTGQAHSRPVLREARTLEHQARVYLQLYLQSYLHLYLPLAHI